MICYGMTILTKCTVRYIPLVVYYVVQGGLTLESVDEMLKCNYESNWGVFPYDAVYYAVKDDYNFLSLWMKR